MGDYKPISDKELHEKTLQMLESRGVEITDIAQLVYFLQSKYFPDITIEECEKNVNKVLEKREVQNAVITGIQMDILAEKRLLEWPLQEIIFHDESLYGIDEIIALSIVNVYGSIGFTNYGYIDKLKPGILEKLNSHADGKTNTFLDDIVGAIAAAASSRIAHSQTR